jgi:hypothetical protein
MMLLENKTRSIARLVVYVLTIVVAVSVLGCASTRTHDGHFDDLSPSVLDRRDACNAAHGSLGESARDCVV